MAETLTFQKLTEIINLQYADSETQISSFDLFINGFNAFMNGGFTDSINTMMKIYKDEYDNQQKINYETIYDESKDIEEREKMI